MRPWSPEWILGQLSDGWSWDGFRQVASCRHRER